MKKLLLSLGVLALLAALGLFVLGGPANATVNDHQITICHATGNPGHYSTPNPTKQQIFDDNGHNSGGGVHPGDIIPPFSAGEHGGQSWGDFAGQNWTTEGIAIYNNGCVVPVEETTTTTEQEATTTTSTSTTIPETTTTTLQTEIIPPIIIEQSGPGTPVPAVVESEELARTGKAEMQMALVAIGLLLMGAGFILGGEDLRSS